MVRKETRTYSHQPHGKAKARTIPNVRSITPTIVKTIHHLTHIDPSCDPSRFSQPFQSRCFFVDASRFPGARGVFSAFPIDGLSPICAWFLLENGLVGVYD